MEPLVGAVLLGFVLGLQHATDPDHLVAVATIVTRERRLGSGTLVGVAWGLGHTATLALAGLAIVGLGVSLPARVGAGLELAAAAMLVLLGAWRLREAFAGLGQHATDHDHGGREVVHRHPHPHAHLSRRLLGALDARGGRLVLRAATVGAVHGLAGSAAVALLVLAAVKTVGGAVLYFLVFGLGTIMGMTALTAAAARPLSLALRVERGRRALAVASGLGAIVVGVVYAARVV
jgi:high-affinity nickel-transport protein